MNEHDRKRLTRMNFRLPTQLVEQLRSQANANNSTMTRELVFALIKYLK